MLQAHVKVALFRHVSATLDYINAQVGWRWEQKKNQNSPLLFVL